MISPKAAHNFAKALQRRAKTDRLDATMLLEFLRRMPFRAWAPPAHAHRADLLTCDAHFEKLPGVAYFKKQADTPRQTKNRTEPGAVPICRL